MPENGFPAPPPSDPPRLDHVGILVRDLDHAIAHWSHRFRTGVARTFEAPAMGISAAFLDVSGAAVELYTMRDAEALAAALEEAPAKLDHVALRLHRADAPELAGCAIRGPGRPDLIEAPIPMGDTTHVWTVPPGIDVLLQLIMPRE